MDQKVKKTVLLTTVSDVLMTGVVVVCVAEFQNIELTLRLSVSLLVLLILLMFTIICICFPFLCDIRKRKL